MEIRAAADRIRLRAHRAARAQSLAAKRAAGHHFALGVPSIILAAMVSTSIFATLTTESSLEWRIATASISALTAIIAALQTFFGFAGRAAKHREASTNYSALKRDIDVFLLRLDSGSQFENSPLDELQKFVDQFNDAERNSPDVPDSLYDRAKVEQTSDEEGV